MNSWHRNMHIFAGCLRATTNVYSIRCDDLFCMILCLKQSRDHNGSNKPTMMLITGVSIANEMNSWSRNMLDLSAAFGGKRAVGFLVFLLVFWQPHPAKQPGSGLHTPAAAQPAANPTN
jgi:hypothetical protein